MPRVVECPLCGDRVRLNAPPARSRVSCPNCKGRFTIDADEAPRRRRKPASRSGGKGVWVALAVGAGVLLVAGAVTAFVLLGGGQGGGGLLGGPGGNGERVGRVPPDLLGYVPNDAFIIRYANVKDQLRALGNDKSRVRLPGPLDARQLEKDYGPLEDVEEVLWAYRSSDFTRGGTVVVIRFSRPVEKARVVGGGNGREAKGKKYYELKPNKDAEGFGGKALGDYVSFPSDTMVVRADADTLAREVLGGDAGKFPEWFRELIGEGDGHIIDARRAPREGEAAVAHGAVGVVEWSSRSGDTITAHTVEVYASADIVPRGREFWEGRARQTLPGERVTFRVSGKRILAEVTLPAGTPGRR
ncbi:MAG TPA: hypothetical protein VKD72_13575 [Gemmataceae bacterium]|nr:hypothetical protein [Gemmataceae bacterium]